MFKFKNYFNIEKEIKKLQKKINKVNNNNNNSNKMVMGKWKQKVIKIYL